MFLMKFNGLLLWNEDPIRAFMALLDPIINSDVEPGNDWRIRGK
jgi:hypothetical protein